MNESNTLNGSCSRPSAAFTRPMWSITMGTRMRLELPAELDDVRGIQVQDQMPAHLLQARDRAVEERHVGPAAEVPARN